MDRSKHLPIELIMNILSRLPAKTLVQFTSVSKSWYAHIKNPNFIYSHIKRHTCTDNCSYVLAVKRKVCSLISDNLCKDHAKIEIPFYSHSSNVVVISSCYGLVCLARIIPCQFTREVFLWNPSIRKFKNLGPSDLILKKSLGDHIDDYLLSKVFVGFGFCECANDYRVVRIVYLNNVSPEVEVYSLRSDSWRRVKITFTFFIWDDKDTCLLFYNGALHWLGCLASSEDCEECSILSFDLNNEAFGQIMLPTILVSSVFGAKLMELKGLLSLFTPSRRGMFECCEWTMREYGDVHSWTNQINILFKDFLASPIGFTKSGKFVYADTKSLHWYDPDSLQSGILATDGWYTADVAYKESLLLLDEGNAPVGAAF